MRLIIAAPYRAHTAPIFQKLNIRPLMTEIKYRRALLAYEMVKDPNSHQLDLSTDFPHDYNTRFSENRLVIPRKRSERYGVQGIEYQLIKAYNELPVEIRNGAPAKRHIYKKRLLPYFK